MKQDTIYIVGAVALGLAAIAYAALPASDNPTAPQALSGEKGSPIVQVVLPSALSPEAQMGQRAFDAVCAACHGNAAAGREGMGPPFIHPIYKPDHHGDMAFEMAVAQGVRAHHWPFGNMPPQKGLTGSDVRNIIAYVRELQHANGVE